MKNLHLLLFIFISLFLVQGCKPNEKTSKEITVTLREAWFPWAGYAGEILATQNDIDSLLGVDFKIAQGAEDIDPIKMVIGGQNDFGIASAENLILSNQKGADLVAVGVLNYKSPTCFITLAESNIKTVQDFEGNKIGILTGTETETVYRLLVAQNNLNKNKLTEVEAPFDLSTFIQTKDYDVRPAFIYDEPVSLKVQNIDFNIIKPEDYGVKIMGAVYFTREKTIRENPEKVQAFIDVLAKGWEKALLNPEYAIESLDKYDRTVDEARELSSFKMGIEYFKGENGKVLYVSDSAWFDLATKLKSLGKIDDEFDVSSCFDNRFINNYHEAK